MLLIEPLHSAPLCHAALFDLVLGAVLRRAAAVNPDLTIDESASWHECGESEMALWVDSDRPFHQPGVPQ